MGQVGTRGWGGFGGQHGGLEPKNHRGLGQAGTPGWDMGWGSGTGGCDWDMGWV